MAINGKFLFGISLMSDNEETLVSFLSRKLLVLKCFRGYLGGGGGGGGGASYIVIYIHAS